MKVLIACDAKTLVNPYLKTLAGGLLSNGVEVTCSLNEFWNNSDKYDIVHIQWPDYLVVNMGDNGEKLIEILQHLKKINIPIICTIHNLAPHNKDNKKALLAYSIVYSHVTVCVHLGNASIGLLKEMYPNMMAEHVVIPHHTYDGLYNMTITKQEARAKLNIPRESKCILSFGSFRNDKERDLIINLSQRLKGPYYLVPGFYRSQLFRKNPLISLGVLIKRVYYYSVAIKNHLHISFNYIPDEMLPFYLKAADVLFIQRIDILNSGNLPLGMLAGLPIVGPDVGNVGQILKDTGNYVFNVDEIDNLPSIVEAAISDQLIGELNSKIAKEEYSLSIIVYKLTELYSRLVKINIR